MKFSQIAYFQTPQYKKWLSEKRLRPDETPDWPAFRDAVGATPKTQAQAVQKGPQPIAGLSAAGRKLIQPKASAGMYNTPIEPAGSGIKRHAKTRAAI